MIWPSLLLSNWDGCPSRSPRFTLVPKLALVRTRFSRCLGPQRKLWQQSGACMTRWFCCKVLHFRVCNRATHSMWIPIWPFSWETHIPYNSSTKIQATLALTHPTRVHLFSIFLAMGRSLFSRHSKDTAPMVCLVVRVWESTQLRAAGYLIMVN